MRASPTSPSATTLAEGTELSPALGIGAFAEKTLHSGQCTKVDPAAPPTSAGLLGCGVMAGVGAAIYTGAVQRGETVAVFGRGGAVKSSWYGDCLSSRDFPMLIDLYLQGRFELDVFVTETIGLDDLEKAFRKMHAGGVLRSVVVFSK